MIEILIIIVCAIIKIVCNEAVTAKKVDNAALETFNMKPGAGGEDLNWVRGDVWCDGHSPDRACAGVSKCWRYRLL